MNSNRYRVVVIGGGIVGTSVLYHLCREGWSDVALIERSELTSGSTWHAAAGFHAFNSDPNLAALQGYAIDLYRQVEQESGISCGMHAHGGINLATTPQRLEVLKSEYSAFKAVGITSARLVEASEIKAMTRDIVRTDDVLLGLYNGHQGHVDPNGSTHALARSARIRGAEIILRNRVVEINRQSTGDWELVTEAGTIKAEHVVNAAGLWARQVGFMAGIDLPVTPMEHHYVVTDTIGSLADSPGQIPSIVDEERSIYARQEGKGLLVGLYEQNPVHWNMDGVPWDFGMELIPENIDRVGDELGRGFERFPDLEGVGIKRWVNGAFTFAPDGNPLVGPTSRRGFWVACGVMAGFSQGAGIGKSLARWIVHGEPEGDVFGMDIARFGHHHSCRDYIRQTTGQFYRRRMMIAFPNEELPAGRQIRTPGAYTDMCKAGACWGNNWGMESPLYFARKGPFPEPGTIFRSADFATVKEECQVARDSVVIADISAYSRTLVTGGCASTWLETLLASRCPHPGRARLAPMLSPSGLLLGDLMCIAWHDGTFWLTGSYRLREWHMRWFRNHFTSGIEVTDISDSHGGFALIGPQSRDLLCHLGVNDVAGMKMMDCMCASIGLVDVRIIRLSLTGELTYELHCHPCQHAQLRQTLLEGGRQYDIRDMGFRAARSMRIEKSMGSWGTEYTTSFSAGMTGLDKWVAWDKPSFIGKEAAQAMPSPERGLCTLEIDADNADAFGFEPIHHLDRVVGMTTSGSYGHRTGKSLALVILDRDFMSPGTRLSVDVAGEYRDAVVIPPSPYDPEGVRMRS